MTVVRFLEDQRNPFGNNPGCGTPENYEHRSGADEKKALRFVERIHEPESQAKDCCHGSHCPPELFPD